jgi:hypothetical protein
VGGERWWGTRVWGKRYGERKVGRERWRGNRGVVEKGVRLSLVMMRWGKKRKVARERKGGVRREAEGEIRTRVGLSLVVVDLKEGWKVGGERVWERREQDLVLWW